MARKKSERHGGDGARKEARAAAEEHEEGQAGGTDNGARQATDVTAAAAAMPPALPPPSDAAARDEALRRAEELVDEWGARLGQYAAQAGQQVLRLAARAREEAEDIWAEAQSIRRGEGGQVSTEEPAAGSGEAARQQAERKVDELGTRLGQFAYGLGAQLRRLAARAREEAEDIWADAQHIRQGQAAAPPAQEEPPHGG